MGILFLLLIKPQQIGLIMGILFLLLIKQHKQNAHVVTSWVAKVGMCGWVYVFASNLCFNGQSCLWNWGSICPQTIWKFQVKFIISNVCIS